MASSLTVLCDPFLPSDPTSSPWSFSVCNPALLELMAWRQSNYGQPENASDFPSYQYLGSSSSRRDPSTAEGEAGQQARTIAEETDPTQAEFELFDSASGGPSTFYADANATFPAFPPYRGSSPMATAETLPEEGEPGDGYASYSRHPDLAALLPSPHEAQTSYYHSPGPLLASSAAVSPIPPPFTPTHSYDLRAASHEGQFARYDNPTYGPSAHPLSAPSLSFAPTYHPSSGDSPADSSPYSSSDSLSPSVGSNAVSPVPAQGPGSERSPRSGLQYSFVPPVGTVKKRPRRKAEEIDRMYKCGWEGCTKGYGTLNHLNAHVKTSGHGEKRGPEQFKEIRAEWKRRRNQSQRPAHSQSSSARRALDPARSSHAPPQSVPEGSHPRPSRPALNRVHVSADHSTYVTTPTASLDQGGQSLASPSFAMYGGTYTAQHYPSDAVLVAQQEEGPSIHSAPAGLGIGRYGPMTPADRVAWQGVQRGVPQAPLLSPPRPFVTPNVAGRQFLQPIRIPPPPSGFNVPPGLYQTSPTNRGQSAPTPSSHVRGPRDYPRPRPGNSTSPS